MPPGHAQSQERQQKWVKLVYHRKRTGHDSQQEQEPCEHGDPDAFVRFPSHIVEQEQQTTGVNDKEVSEDSLESPEFDIEQFSNRCHQSAFAKRREKVEVELSEITHSK